MHIHTVIFIFDLFFYAHECAYAHACMHAFMLMCVRETERVRACE